MYFFPLLGTFLCLVVTLVALNPFFFLYFFLKDKNKIDFLFFCAERQCDGTLRGQTRGSQGFAHVSTLDTFLMGQFLAAQSSSSLTLPLGFSTEAF